jgi:protease-4
MAKLKEYTIREYPEVKNIWQKLMGGESDNEMASRVVLQNPAGAAYVKFWKYYHRLSSWSGVTQMRLPFFLEMH